MCTNLEIFPGLNKLKKKKKNIAKIVRYVRKLFSSYIFVCINMCYSCFSNTYPLFILITLKMYG